MKLAALAGAALIALMIGAPGAWAADPPIGDDVIASARKITNGKAAQGRRELEAMAKAGRKDAAVMLGELLVAGEDLKPDFKVACRYFGQAADTFAEALHSLGFCAEAGGLGRPDDALAARYYQEAADRGFAKSKCALGNMLLVGRGVARDEARAVRLCTEAAEAGEIDAMTDIGEYYLAGRGVARDAVKARAWFEPAAAKGQANAALHLGVIYATGDGVAVDMAAAERWWRMAYENGRASAGLYLGDTYVRRAMEGDNFLEPGDAVLLKEARAWYVRARTPNAPAEARAHIDEMLKDVDAMLLLSGEPAKRR